jgi:hypothetical protein
VAIDIVDIVIFDIVVAVVVVGLIAVVVVELPQDAKTSDTIMRKVSAIQIGPFFICESLI